MPDRARTRQAHRLRAHQALTAPVTRPSNTGLSAGMETPHNNEETYWRHCIIAKPSKAYKAKPRQVSKEIVNTISNYLGTYMTTSDVTYNPPNFIICLHNPHLQRKAVMTATFNTTNFTLQVMPWSKEHESGKLPWITGKPIDDLIINIDPLRILPTPSQNQSQIRNKGLKDNYNSIIGLNYELRAPDYSYLVIADLQDFYYKKFSIFTACKNKAIQILELSQECLQQFQTQTTNIYNSIEALIDNTAKNSYKYFHDFATHLNKAANHAYMNYSILDQHKHLIEAQPDQPTNLSGFKKIPPFHQVPVPSTYVTRLKAIYAAVTKAIYKTEGIITTTKTRTGKFEAYMTLQNSTRKYNKAPQKTPASIEASAIYYFLRQITNVLGYQIVDLNYPTLAQVMTDLNNLSLHMSVSQCCASNVIRDMDQIHRTIHEILDEYTTSSNTSRSLDNAVTELNNTMNKYYDNITNLSNEFTYWKMQFLSTYLDTESLTTAPDRWLEVNEPET